MTTVLDIVTSAMRKIGVVAMDEQPEASALAEGVEAFNYMVSAWKLTGVDTTATDLATTADFPLANEFREGAVYILASRLSSDYMVPASFDADAWYRAIQAAYTTIEESALPAGLTSLPSSIGLTWYTT